MLGAMRFRRPLTWLWVFLTGAALLEQSPACSSLGAQQPMGIIEGHLEGIESSILRLRLTGGKTVECRIDGRTYIDRERRRLTVNELKIEDFLELVTERAGTAPACFARMIHVANLGRRFPGRDKVGSVRRATEDFFPRGEVQLHGVARDVQLGWLEIKPKQEDSLRFKIRPDTVFLRDGQEVVLGQLPRNQPVSIRGGYTLGGDLEVYQVTWGTILQPGAAIARPNN
jgi:hypothetical protein